ncbi:MAG TPA: M48 family metallopeptidase [archaeon]|nr:M48 family metallopeptidase [archaeon]
MPINFYEQISSNKKKTYLLFLAFFLLVGILAALVSYVLGGFSIIGGFFLTIFGILIIFFALISYYTCDSIVTFISGAKEANKEKYKQLINVVEEMSIASGLPLPKVFVIEDTAINAFATGRDPEHSVICVTTGCLTRLNREQLQGVIAHELSHIKNYDIRTMTIATVLVGVSVLLSDFFLRVAFAGFRGNSNSNNKMDIFILIFGVILALLTPFIAELIKLSISRKREFLADASAVELTRNPEGLASALEVISKDTEPLEAANKATAHLYISDPLKNTKGMWFANMFNTHPPINERIATLRGQVQSN